MQLNSDALKISKGVSVVVCCYNSASKLPKTIEHLAKQVTNNIPYEVIIVDNNCTDTTVVVALREWNKFTSNANFNIVQEKTPGLSAARHKGVEEANYEYIIFCDDDNWLEENYVAIAYEILAANPNVGIAGGQSEAITDKIDGLPDWFEKYKGGYAVGNQANETGDITYRKYLWGAGMVFRKTVYKLAFNDKPSMLTDRLGNELSAGGDSEICVRFILLGYRLFYDDRLKFVHFINESRLTDDYRKKLYDGFHIGSNIIGAYNLFIDYNGWPLKKQVWVLIVSIFRIILIKLRLYQQKMEHYNALLIFVAIRLRLQIISSKTKDTIVLSRQLFSNGYSHKR